MACLTARLWLLLLVIINIYYLFAPRVYVSLITKLNTMTKKCA